MTPDDLYGQRALLARTVNDVAKGQLSREDVDDLISDTFVEALAHMVDGARMTAAWLKLRVAGRAYDVLKSKQFELHVALDDKLTNDQGGELDCLPESLIDLDTPEGLYAVRDFIEGLSDQDREIIEMLAEGHSQEAVAEAVGTDQGTISRWVSAIRRQLGE